LTEIFCLSFLHIICTC